MGQLRGSTGLSLNPEKSGNCRVLFEGLQGQKGDKFIGKRQLLLPPREVGDVLQELWQRVDCVSRDLHRLWS